MTGDTIASVEDLGWRPLGRAAPVFTGLSLAVRSGERLGVVGPSGAGKSTLLHALAGLLGGSVRGHVSGTVRRHVGTALVQQEPGAGVVSDRIGRDVAFGPENQGLARGEIWNRVRQSLLAAELPYPVSRPTDALSGGELQRLALAGALALQPGLLLLDEPTSMLDPDQARAVRSAFLRSTGSTGRSARPAMVVVDHHIAPWLAFLDRVVVLDRGTIVADLDPSTGSVNAVDTQLRGRGMWLPGDPTPRPADLEARLVQPSAQGPTITLRDLTLSRLHRTLRGTTRTVAIKGLSACVPGAGLTVITGRSGSGKSTLLAGIAGLISPDEGSIEGVQPVGRRKRPPDMTRELGWVPQRSDSGFLTSSVQEEIGYTSRRLGLRLDATDIAKAMRLDTVIDSSPYRLSGGEGRRLAFAAAFAHRPSLLLVDEPTVGQDRITWSIVVGWLRSAADLGATVVVATHDPLVIALADHRVHLDGRE